jgi:hypothetical protein
MPPPASAVGVSSGDQVRVLLPDRQHAATVVGTVGFGRLDGLASGARVLVRHRHRHRPARR